MSNIISNFTYKIECRAVETEAIYQLASGYYREVIEKEAVLASVTAKDHVLCIGGGSCPFSAILFHHVTGAKVTAIDNDKDCIPKARQVIGRLGISDYVRVFCQDGGCEKMDFSAYSVVHLALQVTPMDSVFSQVEKQVAPNTRVLIRRPTKTLRGIYNELPSPLLTSCPYVAHKSRNIGSTLLYIKQGDMI
jgi:2-polyprenyl-3-methyl-5-hydroxy-6-metoxy-1,4-benzoquinol methylase